MISECRSRARAGAVLVVALAAAATASAQAPATPRTPTSVTFTKDIAPILQRSCSDVPSPDGAGPMSLITYEDVRPYARAIKTRTGLGPARRRHAAVVRREEHRHPEVQERPVAERRGDREDREVGRRRRAARQPGRHAGAPLDWSDDEDGGCSASPIWS